MTYSTTADIKAQLGITGVSHDGIIDDFRDVAYRFIYDYTGLIWEVNSESRYFNAVEDVRNNGRDLVVDYFTAYNSAVNGDGESFIVSDGMIRAVDNRILRFTIASGRRWNWSGSDDPQDALLIDCDWGMGTPTALVIQLEIDLVIWMYRKLDASPAAQVSGALINPHELPPHIRMVLESLRPLM